MNIFKKTIQKVGWMFKGWKSKSIMGEDTWNRFNLFGENTSRDLRNLSRSEYLKFYTWRAFVAIWTIAEEMWWLQRQVVDKNWKKVDHEHESLIDFDLLVNICSYMDLSGSCYVRKNKVWSKIKELIVLRPDRVTVKRDRTYTKVLWYEYHSWSNSVPKNIPVEDVMSFTNFSPYHAYPNNYVWMPTVQAIATTIDSDYQASKRQRKYYYNNANVDAVLESEQDIDEDVINNITEAREQKYRWTDNAHKIGVLTWWLKYKPISASQKEMDFVESRRFNRDEILWFFKVPKAILWLGEWWTALNVRSFDTIFSKRTILPRSRNIEQILNQHLFGDEYSFQFVNIIPADLEWTRNDYVVNWITLNEFRASRGLKPFKNGDKLRSQIMFSLDWNWSDVSEPEDEVEVIEESVLWKFRKEDEQIMKTISNAVNKSVNQITPWTEEYREKQREEKIVRNNRFEDRYNEKLQIIFENQEKEILKEFKKRYKEKNKTSKKAKLPVLSIAKRTSIYYDLLKDTQLALVETEANQALVQVSATERFKVSDSIQDKLKKNIEKFAWSVDLVTNEKIEKILSNVIDEWKTVQEWVEDLQSTFTQLKTSRAKTIVRTETIRAWNEASELWRKQSGVVEKKQWFTALDERVCEFCWPMHWKVVSLEWKFFDKWEVIEGVTADWNTVTMNTDYWPIQHPPLHPNCRCSIVPVL